MTTTQHAAPAVELTDIRRSYGAVTAVDGVSLTIQPGEIVAFLGPNGAGKTTTLDIILGLGEPDSGQVQVLGRTPRQAVGEGLVSAVMQSGGLLKDLTVAETVELTASFYAGPRPVSECLERAGLTEIARRRVGVCSGGEQQRVRFAMALTSDPALLILDEPTTGMDVTTRRAFWDALREDASRGRTIMFATHYLEEAEDFADRIVLVSRGRVVADGSTAQITASVSGRTVSAYFPGSHAAEGVAQALRAMTGVTAVEERTGRLIISCDDSDPIARYLLTQTEARDLEISALGLEAAFESLTGDAVPVGH